MALIQLADVTKLGTSKIVLPLEYLFLAMHKHFAWMKKDPFSIASKSYWKRNIKSVQVKKLNDE